MVQVLDIADRENAYVVGGIVDYFMTQLGRDGQAVENQCMDIAENVTLS